MASIKKRDGSWVAQINKKGVRRSKSFPTKVLAQDWVSEVERELVVNDMSSGEFSSAGSMTITDLMRRYQDEIGYEWSDSKASAARRLVEVMGDLRVDKLSTLTVRDTALRQEKYGLGTLKISLKTLQGALTHAREAWLIDVDGKAVGRAITALEKSRHIPKVRERDRRVSAEEEALIVANWRSNLVPPDVVAFLIDTPLRSGEMCGILKGDIVGGNVVLIRNRKDPSDNARVDRVPLLGRSAAILQAQRTDSPFPYSQDQVSDAFRRAVRAAGLDDIRLHDLRHEGVSRLFARGMPLPLIANITGHKSWDMLKRYTHATAEDAHAWESANS
ncbi:site-specific integrase [Tropicibacter sp. Alg240-R139]|uniref:site-specific integrase n=1 Tax=Tropicibacter sp. Alg240-R139 TaxID=2305991 RepID=UPI0013E08C0A|nr:site-specific integrase [Tropicibacter sp. Alg240-R139]